MSASRFRTVEVDGLECLRCGYRWTPRRWSKHERAEQTPRECPECNSRLWLKPPLRVWADCTCGGVFQSKTRPDDMQIARWELSHPRTAYHTVEVLEKPRLADPELSR